MGGRMRGLCLTGTALMLALFAGCATKSSASGFERAIVWPAVQGEAEAAVGLRVREERTSPSSPNIATLWGKVDNPAWCNLDGPIIVMLRGPGLPVDGVRSQPEDPWSESGGFRFFNLPPGDYHLSLRVPAGVTLPRLKSEDCQRDIPLLENEVVVRLKEGESKEISLELSWNKYGPKWTGPNIQLFDGPPPIDQRSTTTGASIPDTMFQNIPLGPPPDR